MMTDVHVPTHHHELRLRPGESKTLRFHFSAATGATETSVDLVAADASLGRIELSLESFWSAYEMVRKRPGGRWEQIHRPEHTDLAPGRVPVSLDVRAGEIFGIYPEGLMNHALELERASFVGAEVVLHFEERGPPQVKAPCR